MYQLIAQAAAERGFLLYSLPPSPIRWAPNAAAKGLFADPAAAYPRLKALLLLIYPYRVFGMDEPIPAYYLASNRAYHAANELCAVILAAGRYAEPARVPLRALAVQHGIGSVCRNGLLSVHPHGSAVTLQAIATDALPPLPFAPPAPSPCPDGCTLCAAACPTGAIGPQGLELERCMRLYMDSPSHPDWVRERQLHYIGCECCLRACPLNTALRAAAPDEMESQAFDMARLIRGETGAARKLAGKNFTGGGRLTAEAIAFAARAGRLPQDIPHSPHAAVQDAIRWARSRKI